MDIHITQELEIHGKIIQVEASAKLIKSQYGEDADDNRGVTDYLIQEFEIDTDPVTLPTKTIQEIERIMLKALVDKAYLS